MSHLEEVQVQRPCSSCGGGGVAGVVDEAMSRDGYGDDRAVGEIIRCTTCGGAGWLPDVDYVEVNDD